jgi:putative transposase
VLEWYRKNISKHPHSMKSLYAYYGISKQGHWDAIQRQSQEIHKSVCYIGFMAQIRELHPGMGLRTMYEQFVPEGIGRDAFIALGLSEGFRLRVLSTPHITTKSVKNTRYTNLLADRDFTGVNQLWVSDLFYFPLNGRHYYVVLLMDVYSRRIIGYSLADNMRAENNVKALTMALKLRKCAIFDHQLIHHSDRGSQYISDAYTDLLDKAQIRISMCTDVLENAHCERVNGTIKNDYLNRWNIQSYADLERRTKMAVDNYNQRRHQALGKTPLEFETYVNELPIEKRPVLNIFTVKQFVVNNPQLELIFNV